MIKKKRLLLFLLACIVALSGNFLYNRGGTFIRGTVSEKSAKCKTVQTRPNVIFIVIDTARADYFSCNGWKRKTTPNIDAFAQDAVNYRHAHSVSPWTLPAHMSMFTGLLPGEHGATWSAFSDPPDMSSTEIMSRPFDIEYPDILLTKRLKKKGYATLGFSANPWISERTGFAHGFDYFYDTWRYKINFDQLYESTPQELKISLSVDRGDAGRTFFLFKRHLAATSLSEPFFLFFNFIDPHFPYMPPHEFATKFGTKKAASVIVKNIQNELLLLAGMLNLDPKSLSMFYEAELHYVDFVIGKLLEFLRDRGIYDQSLIIITSDHGEHLGENGRYSHQLSIEEELLRIPLFIKYPFGAGAGLVEANPLMSNLDLYQTIISVVDPADDYCHHNALIQPKDLRRSQEFQREFLISEYYYSHAYLRQLQEGFNSFDPAAHSIVKRAVYTKGNKYIIHNTDLVEVKRLQLDHNAPRLEKSIVENLVQTYSDNVRKRNLRKELSRSKDDELVENLKSLGYVND